jgi:hypothetical protein
MPWNILDTRISGKRLSPEQSVKELLCAIIRMAVEDYQYCCERGYIVRGKASMDTIRNKYLVGLNLTAMDVPILSDFFWKGGLHRLITDTNLDLSPSRILSLLEPDWKEILNEQCPECDTSD